jgi:ribosomal protein S18 acetylase RimI-like enzyme
MDTIYKTNDGRLDVDKFLDLVQGVWPGDYAKKQVAEALDKTINITATRDGRLAGCVRILTDGYFFSTIPEILVDPAYQGQGVGRRLMELAWRATPTSLFLGSQPGNEGFFEKLGYKKGLQSYERKKPRA